MVQLVKTDLLNELNTRQGERVMRPTFGTRIFDLMMNPLDDYVEQEVEEDVTDYRLKDPRVEIESENRCFRPTIRCAVQLLFCPRGEDELFIEYTQDRKRFNMAVSSRQNNLFAAEDWDVVQRLIRK